MQNQGGLRPIPQQRIIEKLGEYMSRRDLAGAERHLLYWLAEAQAAGDERGELVMRNELVGHYRKVSDREQALAHAEAALALVEALGFGNTISAGTTYTNAATALNAFGEHERSLELFEKAADLYESAPGVDARLLGGLCNNRALTCVALGRFDEADELYRKALEIMGTVTGGELEQAITYLNMADVAVARSCAQNVSKGSDPNDTKMCHWGQTLLTHFDEACEREVESCLDKALELLDTTDAARDGYYAFVCEKCAPTFAYYGYFLAEKDLMERAQAIYARA